MACAAARARSRSGHLMRSCRPWRGGLPERIHEQEAAHRRRAARNAARRGRTTASRRPSPRRRALLVGMEHRWLLASWGTENRGAARQRVDGVRETRHRCCEVRRRRSGAVCRRYKRPPPWRGGAPPNWLVFRGAASCRRRAAGKHQASPFELPCGLPPPQDSAATLAVRAPLQFARCARVHCFRVDGVMGQQRPLKTTLPPSPVG